VVLFIGAYGWGDARLNTHPPDWTDRPNIIRIVQPSIPQADKWDRDMMPVHLARHLELSENKRPDGIRTVIWPETAIGYLIEDNQKLRWQIADYMPDDGRLITGTLRSDGQNYFNSIFVLDGKNGDIQAAYDKTHLVPFGEYLPLEDYLPVNPVASLGAQFSKGDRRPVIKLWDLPAFTPLICYEVIFSGAIIPDPKTRPNWLLNVTNDAWYGSTTGPYQHLAISRVRAIEEGIPLIRAANNGISAMVGPVGRIGGKLGLNEIGVIDTPLPDALDQPTIFARYGHGVTLGLFIFFGFIMAGVNLMNLHFYYPDSDVG
jgi:apolipoprotein N-acyltransferase